MHNLFKNSVFSKKWVRFIWIQPAYVS